MWLNQTEIAVRILAIIIGATWAYYKFIKGRLLSPRLEIGLSGQICRASDSYLAIVKYNVKNISSVNVYPIQKGTALDVYGCTSEKTDFACKVPEKHLGTFCLLENHTFIEPGRAVQEEALFALPPNGFAAIRLECRVVHKNSLSLYSNISNKISCIVPFSYVELMPANTLYIPGG